MRVFITGGTGFIGQALILRLRQEGHQIAAMVRDISKARAVLGPEVELIHFQVPEAELVEALGSTDAVFNLAGEPLLGGRWTASKKETLRTSRIELTGRLVAALRQANPRPQVLVSASAVGVYGATGALEIDEDSALGEDFLAGLCKDWEAEANLAHPAGVRVVNMRIGVVLGMEGGALGKMLPPFRLGLGGPIGSGRQFVPWIHLADLVELFVAAMRDERYQGPVNATGPEPVAFKRLATAIGDSIGKPAVLPLPSFVVRLIFGQASVVLLTGQRALPRKAKSLGFRFRFDTVEDALRDLLTSHPPGRER